MYGVHTKVSDGTGSIWIDSFGDCAEQMLGVKAEILLERSRFDTNVIKTVFENAKYKVFLYNSKY